ncbi:MAG: ABC transporter permease subunit, partial [Fusobacteriaceae bacterium]
MDLKNKNIKKILLDSGLYIVLLILIAGIIIKEPSFLSFRNMRNILTQSSVRTILALGVAGIIVTGGTDLSVGRQVGLSAVISATLLQALTNVNKVFPGLDTLPIPVVILIVCSIGAVVGFLNGFVVAHLSVTPFVATLGSMIIIYGANSLYFDYVGASPIAGFSKGFTSFAQGFFTL